MIAATIVGAEAVEARLAALPAAVEDGLARAFARLSLDLEAAVARKLSGEVLRARSGALRGSVQVTLSRADGTVTLSLGSTLPYSAFQEYGFDGTESVRAQLRTIRQAFGRTLRQGTEQIAVRPYSRRVDYPAHSFLRSALADLAPEIESELKAAVAEAIA